MLTVTVATRGRKQQKYYRGIGAAARALGVTRIHLYYVLIGERKSPRIEKALRVVYPEGKSK